MPVLDAPASLADCDTLHDLLIFAVPKNKHGNKTIDHLAKLLKLTRWSVNKWIAKNKIPPERVPEVVELSEGRVSIADFSRYVYF